MLNPLSHRFVKRFSNSTSSSTTSLNWRTQIKQSQLAIQISSILLQRQNWIPLLRNLNLYCKLTPPVFLQVLRKTQINPQISLSFFNWVQTHLRFKPDLKSQCHIIQVAVGSGLSKPVKPILESLIQTHPASIVTESMIRACAGKSHQSNALSLVLEFYSRKGLFVEGLEVFRRLRIHGCTPSVRACNALLEALLRENKIGFFWCFYGAIVRDGVALDRLTWSLVAQILCKNGMLEKVVRLLDMGISSYVIYNLVLDSYSKVGDFEAALDRLNEMSSRELAPDFSCYSSILDGACKYKDMEVVERMISIMVEKGLLPGDHSENDLPIQKLCGLGKTYAAEMLFKRSCDGKIRLQDSTCGSVLRALSKEGRTNDAIQVYHVISERGIKVDDSCYNAFASVLCRVDSSEVYELLRDVIARGYSPCAFELSKFIASQCSRRRWGEAEELLNSIVDKGLVPGTLCCCSLIEHYCSRKRIDKAIELHNKLEKLRGSLDVKTYNILLDGLWKEGKPEEAVRVFDYMKALNLVSSESFTLMIRGLCSVNEMRKAMKTHDEMMNMGLKPDKATYKRLISGFK